jgi:ribosome-associated protein
VGSPTNCSQDEAVDRLLKLAGVIDSGAEVKAFLSVVPVWVDGDIETRRGRPFFAGDVADARARCLRSGRFDLVG